LPSSFPSSGYPPTFLSSSFRLALLPPLSVGPFLSRHFFFILGQFYGRNRQWPFPIFSLPCSFLRTRSPFHRFFFFVSLRTIGLFQVCSDCCPSPNRPFHPWSLRREDAPVPFSCALTVLARSGVTPLASSAARAPLLKKLTRPVASTGGFPPPLLPKRALP